MFCTKCGAKLKENALFCSKCGAKVEKRVFAETVDTTQPVTQPVMMDETDLEDEFDAFEEEAPKKSNRKKNENKELVIVIIVLLLLIIIVAGFLLVGLAKDSGLFDKLPFQTENRNEEETSGEGSLTEGETVVEEITAEEQLEDIQSKIAAEEYTEATELIEEVKSMYGDNDTVYLYEADMYLKQGDYLSAISVLEEGIAATSSATLENRKKYICNNVVLTGMTPADGSTGFFNQYDEYGNLLYEERYDSEYKAIGWTEYSYDASGLLVACNFYDKQGKMEKRCEYTYDSAGNLSVVEDYNGSHVKQGWHEYSYDSMGREVEVLDYGKNKKVGWKTKSEYDSYGRLIRNTGYDSKNRASSWVDTDYDSNGNVSKMTRYDSKGKVVEWNETFYDENGKPIEFISYSKNNSVVGSTEYVYDTNGGLTKEIYYNKKGVEIGYAEFDAAGKKVTEQNKETGDIWNYEYRYMGDVLSDTELTQITGTLSFTEAAGYKRIPVQSASYVKRVATNETYQVIGETADYYKVDKGWYFSKTDAGVVYTD